MPSALVTAMAGRPFRDAAELAATAVDLTLARALRRGPAPLDPRLAYRALQTEYGWAAAEAILTGLPPGCPCRNLGPTRLWAGLLAMANLAEALAERDPGLLPLPETRALLISLCLGPLGEGGPVHGPATPRC